jgi:hypothetical protein
MTVLLIAVGFVLLFIWTAGVIRVAERRTERLVAAAHHAFEARLDALDYEVSEGLKELDATVQPTPPRDLFQQRSIELLSQADAVVILYSDSRGFAVRAKVGQC